MRLCGLRICAGWMCDTRITMQSLRCSRPHTIRPVPVSRQLSFDHSRSESDPSRIRSAIVRRRMHSHRSPHTHTSHPSPCASAILVPKAALHRHLNHRPASPPHCHCQHAARGTRLPHARTVPRWARRTCRSGAHVEGHALALSSHALMRSSRSKLHTPASHSPYTGVPFAAVLKVRYCACEERVG